MLNCDSTTCATTPLFSRRKKKPRLMWREFWSRALLTCAIGACSIIGDVGLKWLKYDKNELARAALDNATHATVGGLTWMLIVVLSRKSIARNLNSIFSCFLLASFVDLDHFIAAHSWHIHVSTASKAFEN